MSNENEELLGGAGADIPTQEQEENVNSDIEENTSSENEGEENASDEGQWEETSEGDEEATDLELDENGNPIEPDEALDDTETEDIEIDGKTYVVPKELKASFMKAADYTQKTQEIATQRKEFEARQQDFIESVKMQEALMNDITEVRSIDARLAEYANVNWQAANARDPVATQAAWIEYQQLKDFRSQKVSGIDKVIEKRRSDNAAREAKLVQETVSALKTPDEAVGWTGYTPESMKELSKFANGTLGIPQEDMKRIKSPIAIKTLNLAMLGHKYLQSLKAKAKTAEPKPKVAEPAKKLPAARNNAHFDPMKLPIDKWVIWERNRMANARKAAVNGMKR